jgi:hypothetical protein
MGFSKKKSKMASFISIPGGPRTGISWTEKDISGCMRINNESTP